VLAHRQFRAKQHTHVPDTTHGLDNVATLSDGLAVWLKGAKAATWSRNVAVRFYLRLAGAFSQHISLLHQRHGAPDVSSSRQHHVICICICPARRQQTDDDINHSGQRFCIL